MNIYGQNMTKREILRHAGNIEQVGGLRRLRESEGFEDGCEIIQVTTGAGLRYEVTPSKAMDICIAEFAGSSLGWHGQGGRAHPAHYDAEGINWLRSADFGLLTTCGLTQAGGPCEDNGRGLGLHGRIHNTPARRVCADGEWRGDDYVMKISGEMTEAETFFEHLWMKREITSVMGRNVIEIEDVVENRGFQSAPHMIIYHCNLGWPLISEKCGFTFPSGEVTARDEGVSLDGYEKWPGPTPGCGEKVYYHDELSGEDGFAKVVVDNPEFPIFGLGKRPVSLALSWSAETLPRFIQWKMPGEGVHVLGIEPANCHAEGRVAEREKYALKMLEPGESVSYKLKIEVKA